LPLASWVGGYPLVVPNIANGNPPFPIGNASTNGGILIAMLVYQSVIPRYHFWSPWGDFFHQERMMNDCSTVEDALQLLQSIPAVSPAFSAPR